LDPIRTIALLGNHVPRQCGIATFTSDLAEWIAHEHPAFDCFVLAMNDGGRQYEYPQRVRFEITESDPASYRRAADFLNVNAVDVVSLQHEYGIFGGKAGAHVLPLLRELRMPIVTTRRSWRTDAAAASRWTRSDLGAAGRDERTRRRCQTSTACVAPDRRHRTASEHTERESEQDQLGVEGKPALTFACRPTGNPEHVIDALPESSPAIRSAVRRPRDASPREVHQGEAYRLMLEPRARLGVDESIIHDRFAARASWSSSVGGGRLRHPLLNPARSRPARCVCGRRRKSRDLHAVSVRAEPRRRPRGAGALARSDAIARAVVDAGDDERSPSVNARAYGRDDGHVVVRRASSTRPAH
jgi:hypothetical protein